MPGSDRLPEILALGEPMAEFAAEARGRLGTARTFRRGFGGDTANFTAAAARMGARCGYITRLGDDEFGRAFLSLWEHEGIDRSRVIVEPEGTTAVYFIARREDGGHDFTYYRAHSPASRLLPNDLDAEYLASAKLFHTSGISQAISPSARATVDAALDIVARAGGRVSYDANVRPRLWPIEVAREVIERTLGRAQLAFLSTEDAAHLYPGMPADDVVRRVLDHGPGLVVLKRGADGCTIAPSDGPLVDLPGWPVEVVDTTGAGDAFAGTFVVAWLAGASLDEAGVLANAAGAMTAMGLGAVAPIPTWAAATAFLEERQRVSHHRRE